MNQETVKELKALRQQVIDKFTPHWELNDKAHRVNHFAEVERCGHYINEKLDLKLDPKLIMLGAYFHDLFAWTRINHHELSYQFVLTTDFNLIAELSDSDRHMLAKACLHHRASYKGKFTYTLDELINSADRMMPMVEDVTSIIERSLLCSLSKTNNLLDAAEATFDHVKEKFGTDGYARYPTMYRIAFGDQLAAQQLLIDKLTLEETKIILQRMISRKEPIDLHTQIIFHLKTKQERSI